MANGDTGNILYPPTHTTNDIRQLDGNGNTEVKLVLWRNIAASILSRGEYSFMVSKGCRVSKQMSRGTSPGFSGGIFRNSYHSTESDGHSSWMEGGINRLC